MNGGSSARRLVPVFLAFAALTGCGMFGGMSELECMERHVLRVQSLQP